MQLESNAVEAITSAASATTSVTKSRKRKGKPLTRKKSSKRSSLSSTGIFYDGSSSGSSNSNSNSNSTLDVTHAGNVAMSYDVATIDFPGKDDNCVSISSTEASMKKIQRRQLLKNRTLKCTACVAGNDAEFVHGILSIPICGSCNKNVLEETYPIAESGQELRCTWCGDGK